jgi:photosystem II stability/assembly factor-like uncharacterized protein
MMNRITYFLIAFICYYLGQSQTYTWSNISAAPTNGGKQDGVFFLNKDTGWIVNGSGRIYRTLNAGATWLQQKNAPGTYFRCVEFIDAQIGFAGNVGTGYFPGVTDANPLYKTIDGGNSWVSVTSSITGTVPTGICAIQAVNANVVYAAGRVGSPPIIMKSTDGGNNWVGTDLSAQCQMILDIHFQSPDTGYVFAGSDANIAAANASILRTTDGGSTWTNVYTSNRFYEIIWKASFPSKQVAYATIQSYDASTTQRYVVKTTDGGLTWNELPLVNTGIREFGVGFINDSVGWVGGELTGYQTLNGGTTWTNKNLGQYANKFSIVKNPNATNTCYAVGLNAFKLTTSIGSSLTESPIIKNQLLAYPNPAVSGNYISIALDQIKAKIVKAELISSDGKVIHLLFNNYFIGTRESPFMFPLPEAAAGMYELKFTDVAGKVFKQKMTIKK